MAEAAEQPGLAPKRLFINNINSYASKYIAEFLSQHGVEAPDPETEGDRVTSDRHSAVHVVGTARDVTEDGSHVAEVYSRLSRDELLLKLMDCDVIVYNITQHAEQVEEASWALSALHNEMSRFSGPKTFLLISTVMTWANSKPVDSEDPDLPLTDELFWRRRAHPNFQQHIELEKRVVKMGKTNKTLFATYVVASGLQYGMGEQLFHFFFKTSWLGREKEIPVFGDGRNIVPTIHLHDLASVIQKVIGHQPKPYYLLAVDSSYNTLEDIVKTIASTLGPGRVQKRAFEDAFLVKDLSVMEIDSMSVNLRLDGVRVKQLLAVDWRCESGLVENIELVVEEYRQQRGLQPLRLCVLGPPAVGKSSVCEQISRFYKLHYITAKEAIAETVSRLSDIVDDADPDAEDDDSAAEARELLSSLKGSMEHQGGLLDDQLLVRVMKDKLTSNPCRNQGFVLDSFPETYEQAKELFHDPESEDGASAESSCSKRIIPDFVLRLDASDDFLKTRVINLPEKVVQERGYEQERFLRRLAGYRQRELEDRTVADYFDELDTTPLHLEMTGSGDSDCLLLMQKVFDTLGQPRNYGSGSQELREEKRKQAEHRMRTEAREKAEERMREAEEAGHRAAQWEEWSKALEEVRRCEEERLEERSTPMRSYLMTHVMPILTQGLLECCAAQSQDPVDFLAEHLLRNNPNNY
ncbi:adenylate kinase 7 [Brachionichthys hirsutus]|uniref:adenylate kinase 7 n=1 Tax=Brachionichthys hirsutus TaxID=412623 RepID=UPI003604E1D7